MWQPSGPLVTPVPSDGELEDTGEVLVSSERSWDGVAAGGETREDTMEYLKILLRQEEEGSVYPRCRDYLVASPDVIDEAWRKKMCEWCYNVADQ